MTQKNPPRNPADFPEKNQVSHPGKTPGPAETNPFSEGNRGTTGGTGNVDPSAPTSGTEIGGSGHAPEKRFSLRCADLGNASCDWETNAGTTEALVDAAHRHLEERHGGGIAKTTDHEIQGAIHERRVA